MSDAATFEAEEKKDEEEEDEEQEIDMEELMEFREEQRLELIRLLEEKFLAGKDVCVITNMSKLHNNY
jgi:hypothetical protein